MITETEVLILQLLQRKVEDVTKAANALATTLDTSPQNLDFLRGKLKGRLRVLQDFMVDHLDDKFTHPGQ